MSTGMAFSFLQPKARKREWIVAIDLGGHSSKAVHLQRKGGSFNLLGFSVTEAPASEKAFSVAVLTEHLKKVVEPLGLKTKQVTIAVGVAEALLRNTELPQIPVSEMRLMLKLNAKNYLQQDLAGYVFDCHIMPPKALGGPDGGRPASKFKVWVGGAKQQLLAEIQAAIRAAGLTPDQITPSVIGPINAFELAFPEFFQKDVVALVDLGFRNSTISILNKGELALSRVVGIGGDKITMGLAESLGVNYAEAEGIKVGMPGEVESSLQPLLSPLGRELRTSIDFFEHQADQVVAQVFVSGAASRSDFIVQTLQAELMAPCQKCVATSFLNAMLPAAQAAELEQVAPQLTTAIGAAMTLA
jgi:type IV pilus assembly protein PilM